MGGYILSFGLGTMVGIVSTGVAGMGARVDIWVGIRVGEGRRVAAGTGFKVGAAVGLVAGA
jgi:hypothetical protein